MGTGGHREVWEAVLAPQAQEETYTGGDLDRRRPRQEVWGHTTAQTQLTATHSFPAECRGNSAECRVHSTECRVQSTEYGIQSAQYRVQSTECRVHSAEYRPPPSLGAALLGGEATCLTSHLLPHYLV